MSLLTILSGENSVIPLPRTCSASCCRASSCSRTSSAVCNWLSGLAALALAHSGLNLLHLRCTGLFPNHDANSSPPPKLLGEETTPCRPPAPLFVPVDSVMMWSSDNRTLEAPREKVSLLSNAERSRRGRFTQLAVQDAASCRAAVHVGRRGAKCSTASAIAQLSMSASNLTCREVWSVKLHAGIMNERKRNSRPNSLWRLLEAGRIREPTGGRNLKIQENWR